VLLCEGQGDCAEEQALVLAAGLASDRALERMDALLELDAGAWTGLTNQRVRFEEALKTATEAGARQKWREVEGGVEIALDALERWPGTVPREQLFAVQYLLGASRLHLRKGKDDTYAWGFRQAAAIVDGRPPDAPPIPDPAAARAFTDELRKVTLAGRGRLIPVILEPGTHLHVDGVRVENGVSEVPLLPGTHRVTATREGRIRTWKADVPILGERASTVRVVFPESSSGEWVVRALAEAFDTLQAPPEVTALLADWCLRRGLDEVRLLRVASVRKPRLQIPITLADPPALRPEAVEGEKLNLGDGVPGTYEDHVLSEQEARFERRPDPDERRVRVVWFEPVTRRFHTNRGTETRLEADPEGRFRLGLRVGYLHVMDRHHGALDLVGAGRAGPLLLEAEIGAIRADLAYNLYEDWVDAHLYHALLGARWCPVGHRVRPSLGLGAEAFVPVALGGRADAGIELALGKGWLLGVRADAHLLDGGFGLGGGLGIGFVQ
jgi:hypothetical protein